MRLGRRACPSLRGTAEGALLPLPFPLPSIASVGVAAGKSAGSLGSLASDTCFLSLLSLQKWKRRMRKTVNILIQ